MQTTWNNFKNQLKKITMQNIIWKNKYFKTFEEQEKWMNKNKSKYQMVIVYVNNSYCTEYRKLNKIY